MSRTALFLCVLGLLLIACFTLKLAQIGVVLVCSEFALYHPVLAAYALTLVVIATGLSSAGLVLLASKALKPRRVYIGGDYTAGDL